MSKCVYGADTSKKLSPKEVRDAMIKCFLEAHGEVLDQMREYSKDIPQDKFEKFKHMNAETMVKKFFEEVGGDFNKPTKDDLFGVIERLKKMSASFRSEDVIDKHEKEMRKLIQMLP